MGRVANTRITPAVDANGETSEYLDATAASETTLHQSSVVWIPDDNSVRTAAVSNATLPQTTETPATDEARTVPTVLGTTLDGGDVV